MSKKNNFNLSRKQTEDLLKDPQCQRVPSLDVGGLLEAYQLADGKMLLRTPGEGSVIYESKEELEALKREEEEYIASLPKPTVTVFEIPLTLTDLLKDSVPLSRFIEEEYPLDMLSEYSSSKAVEWNEESRNWLLEFVRYYRNLQFFYEYKDLPDHDLARQLESFWEEEMGVTFDPSDPKIDLYLLRWDNNRVWWHDTEADVCIGNEVYASTLEDWADISRGVFIPEDVTETWKTSTGPIELDFTYRDKRYRIDATYLDDWLDLNILSEINQLIREKNYQFEVCNTGEQTGFVTVLTPAEKLQLEAERGWKFGCLSARNTLRQVG
jgi:hypothetical protein